MPSLGKGCAGRAARGSDLWAPQDGALSGGEKFSYIKSLSEVLGSFRFSHDTGAWEHRSRLHPELPPPCCSSHRFTSLLQTCPLLSGLKISAHLSSIPPWTSSHQYMSNTTKTALNHSPSITSLPVLIAKDTTTFLSRRLSTGALFSIQTLLGLHGQSLHLASSFGVTALNSGLSYPSTQLKLSSRLS